MPGTLGRNRKEQGAGCPGKEPQGTGSRVPWEGTARDSRELGAAPAERKKCGRQHGS